MVETFDPHKSTTEVRQADRRRDNFRVLLIGTAAVIAAFVILYLGFQLFSGAGTPV